MTKEQIDELVSACEWAIRCLKDEACVPDQAFVRDCLRALEKAVSKADRENQCPAVTS